MDSSSKTTVVTNCDPASRSRNMRNLHLRFAQELNNSAAMSFERGLYERATSSLHTGLKLLINMDHNNKNKKNGNQSTHDGCCACGQTSETKGPASPQQQEEDEHDFCCNHPATLDGCITFSEQTSFLLNPSSGRTSKDDLKTDKTSTTVDRSRDSVAISCQNGTKKRRISRCSNTDTAVSNNLGYVYRRPVRIPLEGFCCCHRGYTNLLVVIVFNLAIVHHVHAIKGSIDATTAANKTKDIVYLYGLCLDLLHPSTVPPSKPSASDDTRIAHSCKASARFELIIRNNLSQLYQIGGNSSDYKSSLRYLLSSLMVMIERGTRESSDVNHNSDDVGSSSENYWWDAHRWNAMARKNGEPSELIDGVLENLNHLMIRAHCADAA